MLVAAAFLAAITFAETKAIRLQVELDRAGFSCNTIDGVWGPKSEQALARYASTLGAAAASAVRGQSPDEAYGRLFKSAGNPYKWVEVTEADLSSLVSIPASPAAKAELPKMGYETIAEMFAERGHVSIRALERLNPKIDFTRLRVGTKIRIPNFPAMEEDLAAWPRTGTAARPEASLVRISLARCEVTAYDAKGKLLASFPCSVAKDKANLPPHGELKVTTAIANPNYTYTPDGGGPRHILPEGPNSPVGVAWIGLSLPGYGIHGTPRPETIGSAESHGCFRLANWNAARLYAMVRPGVRVIVEE